MKQDNQTLRDALKAVVKATLPYHQNDVAGRPWLADALSVLGAQPEPVRQGTLLPDGSVVAVVVSPEDIQTVAEAHYEKTLTFDAASKCIYRCHGKITDALLIDWAETLSDVSVVGDFIQNNGEAMEVS